MIKDSVRRELPRFPKLGTAGLVAALIGFGITPALGQSQAQPGPGHNSFVAAVQGSPTWQACDRYYDQVDALSSAGKHYEIRETSIAFVKNAPQVVLRSEPERFLLIECVNLANGNATHTHERIGKQEHSDSEFFDNLVVDTINNSNAAQHDYVGEIEGKYHLEAEVDAGRAELIGTLEEGRRVATQKVLMGALVVGAAVLSAAGASRYAEANSYNNYGSTYSGNGANQLASSFQNLANLFGQAYQNSSTQVASSGGGITKPGPNATSASGGNLPFTIAKPQKAPGPQIDTSPAPGPQSGRLVPAPPPPPLPRPMDNKAAHLDPTCVRVSAAEEGAMAQLQNTCEKLVEWHWCWLEPGQKDCQPQHYSGVIGIGESKLVHGPGIGKQLRTKFVVCDMSDREKFCSL